MLATILLSLFGRCCDHCRGQRSSFSQEPHGAIRGGHGVPRVNSCLSLPPFLAVGRFSACARAAQLCPGRSLDNRRRSTPDQSLNSRRLWPRKVVDATPEPGLPDERNRVTILASNVEAINRSIIGSFRLNSRKEDPRCRTGAF